MTPDVVVDIGNSRIKWGWCGGGRVERAASLGDDPAEWDREIGDRRATWAVVSVHPPRLSRLLAWTAARGDAVAVIDSYHQIPIPNRVRAAASVGLDRLCAGLAAWRLFGPRRLLVVQVGTAVVVDLVTETGDFMGGVILPGFHLMARSLTVGTAQLPPVSFADFTAADVGRDTTEAIQNGIYHSVVGAVERLRTAHSARVGGADVPIVLAGGDAGLIVDALAPSVHHVPLLTLEGVRLTAETLP